MILSLDLRSPIGRASALLLNASLLTPVLGEAAPPAVTSPVVATMDYKPNAAITIAGTGLVQNVNVTTPRIFFGAPYSQVILKTDTSQVERWDEDQILLVNLPDSALKSSMQIYNSGGVSSPVSVAFMYSWAASIDDNIVPETSALADRGKVLAVGVGENGAVWTNREFESTPARLEPGQDRVNALYRPNSSNTDNYATDAGESTKFIISAEDVKVDGSGHAWFPASGAYLNNYQSISNHSVISRYNPGGTSNTDGTWTGTVPLSFNIPGNNNRLFGLALDTDRNPDRIWFSNAGRSYNGNVRATLMSFEPRVTSPGITPGSRTYDWPTAGYNCTNNACSCTGDNDCALQGANISFKKCDTNADCVDAHLICRPGSTCDQETGNADANYYHQYELPGTTGLIAHILTEKRGSDRNVWYTVYQGFNPPNTFANTSKLGRLDPTIPSGPGNPEEYPLMPLPPLPQDVVCTIVNGELYNPSNDVRCPGAIMATSTAWQIVKSPEGDIVFNEQNTNRLARFDAGSLTNTDCCLALSDGVTPCNGIVTPAGVNPCIEEVVIPTADLAHDISHSITYYEGNLWFTLAGGGSVPAMHSTIGYLEPDWNKFVMLPRLSVLPVLATAQTPAYCADHVGDNIGMPVAGITTDPVFGDLWFAEGCRDRLGHLRKLSTLSDFTWTVSASADDAWEEFSATNPSKPKTTATTLRLDSQNGQGEHRAMAAFRLTSDGNVSGQALTSHLKIPIVAPGQNRHVKLRVYVGVPNDAAWNVNANGDIKNRTKLASYLIERDLVANTTQEIVVDDGAVTHLLDAAQRHANWIQGGVNVVPFYVARNDDEDFVLVIRAREYNPTPPATTITGIRTGA